MNADIVRARLLNNTEVYRNFAETQAAAICDAGLMIATAIRNGRKLLLFGNGGSAADAQHLAAEFIGRFVTDRRPLPALALTTDSSILTCVANDFGFNQVFVRQIRALGQADDVCIAISTSGESENVLLAVDAARDMGLRTIGLMGGTGGRLRALVDVSIVVPSTVVARIQECHIAAGHLLCEIVDASVLSAK